jgi:hypothetical protein
MMMPARWYPQPSSLLSLKRNTSKYIHTLGYDPSFIQATTFPGAINISNADFPPTSIPRQDPQPSSVQVKCVSQALRLARSLATSLAYNPPLYTTRSATTATRRET